MKMSHITHANANGFNFQAGDPSRHDRKSGAIRLNGVVKVTGGSRSGGDEVIFDTIGFDISLPPLPGRTGLMVSSERCHYAGEVDGGEPGSAHDYPAKPAQAYATYVKDGQ
jgi:hypothetical protein